MPDTVPPTLSRRHLLLGVAAGWASCAPPRSTSVPNVRPRPRASLPTTTLPWLSLRDHFVATVGVHAGRGRPLGPLLVLADATFAPRSRFPLHPHREMEILSLVIDGELSHHGDQAHGATLGARSAQLISAREGMVHAEGNDTDRPTRMLQLWFEPTSHGGAPAYFTRTVRGIGRELVAGDEGMPLRADAKVWWQSLVAGASETVAIAPGRRGYLLAMRGSVAVTSTEGAPIARLDDGDGAEVGPGGFSLASDGAADVLLVDLP